MRHLKKLLEKLHLSEERGVILLSKYSRWIDLDTNIFSFETREQLHQINPSAVYHFNNQPFILFFDKSNKNNNTYKDDIQIFREVWSWDFVPVIFIIYPNETKIFNAFNYQKQLDKTDTLQELTFKKEEDKYEIFSFWQLQSGDTWKWIEENFYKKGNRNLLKKQRVNHKLFENIKYAREALVKEFPHPEFINILILRLIFIRYLIDREVGIDEDFIQGNSIKDKRICFNQLIGNKSKLLRFFNHLKARFNGNLFETDEDPIVTNTVLNFLQQFFSDGFTSKQNTLFYFDVFDFSIIPVEVISGIYESVIDAKKRKQESAVYTPLFLANYILNNTVDKHLNNGNKLCKVLDPSCGSGIFLTQTYRRLIEHEKQLGTLTDERLKTIAQEHIFGIDRDINALNVAAFSIYISILDYKKPKEIKTFHLPKLIGKNLFRNDFFNEDDSITSINDIIVHPFNQKLKKEAIDFIIGNPPWGSKNHKTIDKFHLKYAKKMGNLLSNYEISQSFLIRAKDFSTKDTIASLIVASSAFYNADKFKDYFFHNFLVNTILDLSAARRMVFQGAVAPCIVVVYKFAFFQQTNNNTVQHLSIKPNRFLKNYKTIVIDSNNIKNITQKYFTRYSWFFKVALFGNALDFLFLKRLESLKQIKTIDNCIDNKTDIFRGNGIHKGAGTSKQYYDFLIGMTLIHPKEVNLYYHEAPVIHNILKTEDTYLERGRKKELFLGEQIFLHRRAKKESELHVSYSSSKGYVFKNSMYGITTKTKIDILKQFYGLLISHLSTYFQFLTSSSWGVSTRPEISLSEYLSTPFIQINDENFISQVNNFIETYKNYYTSTLKSPILPNPNNLDSFKKINKIINKTYAISPIEKDLIDYALDVSRYQFQESKLNKFLRKPNPEELKEYAKIFYNYFSTVYNEQDEYFQVEIYILNHFITIKFLIVENKPLKNKEIIFSKAKNEQALFEKLAYNLSIYELSSQLFIQKDVRGYEENYFYIIKPNEYKCWHRAIAHHDLVKFKTEMMQAEIDLKTNTYE